MPAPGRLVFARAREMADQRGAMPAHKQVAFARAREIVDDDRAMLGRKRLMVAGDREMRGVDREMFARRRLACGRGRSTSGYRTSMEILSCEMDPERLVMPVRGFFLGAASRVREIVPRVPLYSLRRRPCFGYQAILTEYKRSIDELNCLSIGHNDALLAAEVHWKPPTADATAPLFLDHLTEEARPAPLSPVYLGDRKNH